MAKEMKVYSRLHEIPRGKASSEITPGCLVLEGGAFRGLYTSGVLDCLMVHGINLQTTVGVSAGALNGVNYVSGDIGRSASFNLYYRHDSRWVGFRALRESKSITGFRFLWDEADKVLPFNAYRFFHSDQKMVAVATNCLTGQPEYFSNDQPHIQDAVSASASMPFVSRMVRIDGKPYLDGGCSVKIPLQYALDHDFSKIVVVTTRDASYRRKSIGHNRLMDRVYKNYPHLIEAFLRTNDYYNETCDRMDTLTEEGRIFRISPSKPVTVSRLEGDMEKLGELYWLGYHDAEEQIEELKTYLNIE